MVSALLLTISFPIVMLPTDDMIPGSEEGDDPTTHSYINLMCVSLLMSLTTVLMVSEWPCSRGSRQGTNNYQRLG